jgi:uncharacterized surface anchored protein
VSGGVFNLYYVAGLDDTAVLSYTLKDEFKEAAAGGGLDINAVKTASQLESAAVTLAQYTSGATAVTTLTTTGAGTVSANGLKLGIYLVVQTGTPANYSTASPFLAYIPMMSSDGTGWVYGYTASPKISYSNIVYPQSTTVDVQVIKVWEDKGFESERPDSIEAGLYRNGTLYKTQELSEDNNWKYVWRNLSESFTWTVNEIDVPENYSCFVENSGENWVLTNSREDVPLSTTMNVTKEWIGDDSETRPDSNSVTLFRDGETYSTVELTAGDGWQYAWAGWIRKGTPGRSRKPTFRKAIPLL